MFLRRHLRKRAANEYEKLDEKLESHIVKETTSYDLSQQRIQGAPYVGHNLEASADRIACLIRTRRNSR
jgi:hypothetical protein